MARSPRPKVLTEGETVTALRRAIRAFADARATDHLFTWLGVHVTKVHVYGAFAGTLTMIDYMEGHFLYSAGVWGVALMDMSRDI